MLMTTRVLLIGFEYPPQPRQDESLSVIRIRSEGEIGWGEAGFRKPQKKLSTDSYSRAFFEPALPTAYDYHIVVVSKEAVYFVRDSLSTKKDDLISLMYAPFQGILVVPIIGGSERYSDWVPSIDRLKERQGGSLKLREKHWAHHFMKKYEKSFTWKAHADFSITSYDDSLAQRFIATNIADNPVAFEFPMGSGRTIFLPFYNFTDDRDEVRFIRDLLDSIKSRYKFPEAKIAPSWISKANYMLPSEEDLDKQARAIEGEKIAFNRIKSILWLDGTDLVGSVSQTLGRLGIQCENKETEGRHDIEIREPEFHAIIEVKGLSAYADSAGVRQLLDWHSEASKEDENVKGIFLVNDYREVEPEMRQSKMMEKVKDGKYPFTKDAERIANNLDFCLLTTYQLFEVVKLKLTNKFDKADFLRKLKNTKGVFRLT